ncbi:unnamed protein product [Rhizophagus irregularis]|nr:unnamed protein product [Rhizophagus irregularis]
MHGINDILILSFYFHTNPKELNTPESIVEFLARQEGVKDDFTKPHKLCGNEFNFQRKGRDETLHQIYDFIIERYIRIKKTLEEKKSVGDKSFHPVLALQATPGGGKSFLLDELANLKENDLNNYLKSKEQPNRKCLENVEYHSYIKAVNNVIDMLRNSIAICITYNGHSTYKFDRFVDENLERGLVMRILWSYFFDDKELRWGDFCKKFRTQLESLEINTAVKSILHHIECLYGSKRSVFLCVDESLKILSRDNSNQKNQDQINNFLINLYNPYQETLDYKEKKGSLIRFNFIITTLDAVYVRETRTHLGRDINWAPLRRLDISESMELFDKFTEELDSNRAYIINRCISDCNGHPRTLEKFYKLLNGSNTTLKTNNFATLIEELTKSIDTWFSNISFSVVKLALLGKEVDLERTLKVKGKDLSIKDLISTGIYINSVTEQSNVTSVIPTLTLVSLYYFCMTNSEDGDAKTVAKTLKNILLLEDYFDFRSNDGKAFESFHMNWELLYRTLHDDGMEINLPEIYGLDQEGVKIKIQRKEIVKLPRDREFPNNEICDEKNNIIKDLEKYIFVPMKSNNSGFEMVIFEKKVGGGYIAINIECKFSWPKSNTSYSDIQKKYKSTVDKYLNHIKTEPQMKTRSTKMELQATNTPVGKLEMTKDDIYLVVISWRNVANLDSDIRRNKNIIVVKKENLEKIYSPSLVSRPQFYDKYRKRLEI